MSRKHTGLDARHWGRVRRAVLDRDGWRCRDCGRAGRLEVHHVQPLELGGAAFDLDNLRTVCFRCHHDAHRPTVSPAVQRWRELVDSPL